MWSKTSASMKLRNVLAIIKLRSKTGSPSLRRVMSDKNGIPDNTIDERRNDYDIILSYDLSSK